MKVRKILFLDLDGVICLSNNWGGRAKKWSKYIKLNPGQNSLALAPVDVRFDNLDKKSVKVLNQIIEETGCDLVISSDWRLHATLDEIGGYFLSQGMIKKPIDMTKRYIGCDKPDEFEWVRNTMYEQQRCIEINQYLMDHPDITHWVCVDDLELGVQNSNGSVRKWGITNFVRTPRDNEGIKQSGIKEKIVKYLTH